MSTLEKDIAAFLAASGQGTYGTDVFYSALSEQIDNQVVVQEPRDTPSIESASGRSRVIVTIRNLVYDTGAGKALAIAVLLHNKTDLLSSLSGALNSVGYSRVTQRDRYQGRDKQNRHVWFVECEMLAIPL